MPTPLSTTKVSAARIGGKFVFFLFAVTPLLLGGCVGGYDFSVTSSEGYKKARSQCAALFNDPIFSSIRTKMAVGPDDLPTRAMVTLMDSPTKGELGAIKRIEEAYRSCKQIRLAANLPTTASEDILENQLSKLRYGLFNGDIPYAVYNYGVAQALRDQARFENEGAVAFQKGREIGKQRLNAELRQMATEMQLDSIKSQLNSYYNAPLGRRYWNCSVGPVTAGFATVSCY